MARSLLIRLTVVAVWLSFASIASALPARADGGTRMTVRVIDQVSKRGLDFARVILGGPAQRLGFTDENGSLTFDDLVPGEYRLAVSAADHRAQTFSVTVGEGIAVSAVTGLAPANALKTIGRVSVQSKRARDVVNYNADGAIRRTTDNLADALRFDPAVVVGPSGSISLGGQPSTATGLTLDGIPLAGSGFDSRRLGADLFSSMNVSQEPANGASAGSVNLRSFDPTVLFRSAMTGQYGSDGGFRVASVVSGTSGNVGYAVSAARSRTPGTLDGQRFLDASGSDFIHADSESSNGILAKLRVGLSASSNVVLTALHSDSRSNDSCATLNGPLACSYGPGAFDTNALDLAGLTFTGVYGRFSLTATPYVRRERDRLSYPGQVDDGVAAAQSGALDTSTLGARFAADLVGSSAVSYHATGSVYRSAFTTSSAEAASALSLQATHVYEDIAAGASAKLRPNFSLAPTVRFTRTDTATHLGGDVSARWTPTHADSINLAYIPRSYGVGVTIPQTFSTPASLAFDCGAHNAVARAAGTAASEPATSSVRLDWAHERRGVKTIVSAFRTRQVNALVPTFVNLTGLPPGVVPADFLAGANSLFTSPYACPGAAPLSAGDILVGEPVTIPAQTTTGASVAAALALRSSLVVIPSYSATFASADQLGAEFDAPRSIVIAGRQLPGVPMHRWSLLADYRRPGSRFEAIASLTHTSGNNPYGLPAYTLLNAGVSLPLGQASLVVSGTNLTNAFGSAFASSSLGVPLAVNAGAPVRLPAYPLPPRRIAVAVRFAVGSSALRSGETVAPLSAPEDDDTVRRFDLEALPDAAPRTPAVAVDPAAPSCVPESLRDARRILAALQAYAAQLDRSADPANEPLPRIDGIVVTRHALGSGFELRFKMDQRATLAVARCGAFTYADRDDVKRAGLADRSDLASWQLDFRYARRYGLFLVERPETIVAHGDHPALPSAPPADAFATVPGPACAAADTRVARDLLVRLRAGLEGGAGASDPAFTIARHAGETEAWYSIDLRDSLLITPLLNCAAVASASPAELRRRGLDGSPPPALNYAKRVGWYIVGRDDADEHAKEQSR